jgi:hypothetical protein
VLSPAAALAPAPAAAGDLVATGTCLLQKCQLQLAECLGDPLCLRNIVCLNTCNNSEDEAGCQIRCEEWCRACVATSARARRLNRSRTPTCTHTCSPPCLMHAPLHRTHKHTNTRQVWRPVRRQGRRHVQCVCCQRAEVRAAARGRGAVPSAARVRAGQQL